MAEIWELVDINENKTGVLIERGSNTPIPDGMFHMAVEEQLLRVRSLWKRWEKYKDLI